MAIAPSPWRDLLARLCGLRSGFHLAALDEVDLGIEDDHVTFLDAVAYFHLRPQIPCHGYFSNVGVTTLDHGDLKFHTDFRSVYSAVLENWFGWRSEPILGQCFTPADVLQA